MIIKDMMHKSINGFELDTDKIKRHTVDERAIKLPYTGDLPAPYDTATINFRITPEHQGIVISSLKDKTEKKYIVEASRDEIKDILWSFFYKDYKRESKTRFDTGLTDYWLAYYQQQFTAWHLYGAQPVRIIGIIRSLPAEKQAELLRYIEKYRAEETEE